MSNVSSTSDRSQIFVSLFSELTKSTNENASPDGEIEVWEAIAGSYQQFLKQTLVSSFEVRSEVYKLILLRSNMLQMKF
ncbi:MAG: hypothetical protein ABI844_18425 [Saprospiraceae bacterium]